MKIEREEKGEGGGWEHSQVSRGEKYSQEREKCNDHSLIEDRRNNKCSHIQDPVIEKHLVISKIFHTENLKVAN